MADQRTTDRLPHVREPFQGEPDVCVHCLEEWVDLLTLYETDECSVRLRAEVERLRADLDALSKAVGQAVVASSLAAGETLVDPIPHIIVSTVTRLRAEALGQRADNAEIGALAYADGAEAERAAVVAWLRGEVDMRAPVRAGMFLRCAAVIERGEHRREGGEEVDRG